MSQHICHISTTFNTRSGSARRTTAILKKCVQEGYETSLIIGRDHDIAESDIPGVTIYQIPELVKYVSLKSDLIAPYNIFKLLRKINPDIVHTHLAKGGILGRFAAHCARTPYIVHTVHGPTFPHEMNTLKRMTYRIIEKWCGYITDSFVFVGGELRQSYIEAAVCSEKNSMVIHTGRPGSCIDRQQLSKARKDKLRKELCKDQATSFLIVTVGRVVPSKQFEHGVSILKHLLHLNIDAHLVIVGKALLPEEQQYEKDIQKLAVEQKIHDRVIFTGYRDDVLDIMDAADAVLLTSRYEGLPNVAVESLIAGTPMVTYNVSGVKEVLSHKTNGFILEQNDINSSVKALQFIYDHPEFKEEMTGKERMTNLRSFRESVMIDHKAKFYNNIIKSL